MNVQPARTLDDETVRRACQAAGWCSTAAFEEAEALRREMSARGEQVSLLDALVILGALDVDRARQLRSGELPQPAKAQRPVINRGLPPQGAKPAPQAAHPGHNQNATVAFSRAQQTNPGLPAQKGNSTDHTLDFDADDLRAALKPKPAQTPNPRATIEAESPAPHADEPSADPQSEAPFGADLPGRVLGGCRLERELGRGAMGVVFEATHLSLQRRVAVKVLMPSAKRSQKDVEQFFQEARALARIEHQNIVQVHDVGEQDGLHYITMQLLQGETVADRLDRQRVLPWEEACRLARDAANGLAVAHEKGIVHRDIKPENLFLTTEGVVKIADFGLAAQAANGMDGTRTEVMGTPAYMSPEQIDGCNVDGRSDLYSMGCALYVMLTGRKPFDGDTAIEVLLKQTKDVAPPVAKIVPTIPLSVSQVVEKLMAKAAAARYQKAEELAADLEKILGGGKPKVVVEIEDVMGRMQDLAREVSAPQTSLAMKPSIVLAAAAVLVAAAAVVMVVLLPGVDDTALAAGAGLPTAEDDAQAERAAREALNEVEAFVAKADDRPDLVAKQYDELQRKHGDTLRVVIQASRELSLQRCEAKRAERMADTRKRAAQQFAADPVAAVRILLSLPEDQRAGAKVEEWAQDLDKAMTAVRQKTGMAYIPAGKAKLGSESKERELHDFLIDLVEVSNHEYGKFVLATNARTPKHWGGNEPPSAIRDLPVVGVTAAEADAYAKWAGKRLATAEEWERAARGPDGRLYPWAGDYDATRCVAKSPVEKTERTLVGVQTFPGGRAAEGIYHMAGNAVEWTADSANDPLVGQGREVRGGSAKSHPATCVASVRYWMPEETDDPDLLIGFRCAK